MAGRGAGWISVLSAAKKEAAYFAAVFATAWLIWHFFRRHCPSRDRTATRSMHVILVLTALGSVACTWYGIGLFVLRDFHGSSPGDLVHWLRTSDVFWKAYAQVLFRPTGFVWSAQLLMVAFSVILFVVTESIRFRIPTWAVLSFALFGALVAVSASLPLFLVAWISLRRDSSLFSSSSSCSCSSSSFSSSSKEIRSTLQLSLGSALLIFFSYAGYVYLVLVAPMTLPNEYPITNIPQLFRLFVGGMHVLLLLPCLTCCRFLRSLGAGVSTVGQEDVFRTAAIASAFVSLFTSASALLFISRKELALVSLLTEAFLLNSCQASISIDLLFVIAAALLVAAHEKGLRYAASTCALMLFVTPAVAVPLLFASLVSNPPAKKEPSKKS